MNDRIVFWLLLYTVLINTLLLAYLAWRTWRDHRPAVSSLTFHVEGACSPNSAAEGSGSGRASNLERGSFVNDRPSLEQVIPSGTGAKTLPPNSPNSDQALKDFLRHLGDRRIVIRTRRARPRDIPPNPEALS